MATHVTAVQVGSYFVGQYYQVLQQQPDFVHQFYTDLSTMLRVDGSRTESATAMLQIHSLIMSLNFTGIEIKTAHSLDSWNGGVIVMVSGSVQTKDFNGKRKFMQTFFLAPQEKGYFVLNDIFHFLDEEPIHQQPAPILAQNAFDSTVNVPSSHPEPDYILGGDIQATEFVTPVHVEENEPVDNYNLQEEQQQQVLEVENRVDETQVEEPTASFQSAINSVRDPPTAPIEEPVGEPPKQTYASILRIARGQSASSVAPQPSLNKSTPTTSEWLQTPQPTFQQSNTASSIVPERSGAEAAEEVTTPEEEGELRSVYVRNLPPTVSVSDIEQEFKNFGRIKPDGVAIRHRKDVGICYAFVEFEDIAGVQNAIQASPIQLCGRQVHIEERRASSSGLSRGGRRGRGRGGYQTDAPRGRFGGGSRGFGRGSGLDSSERDYNSRPRGNGFHQRGPRQDRGILGNQVSRNGQNPSEATF
ncbi:PREDICTED: putative G3BP-like protein isoform X2 [Nelumbo nucifera]|uniref:G3BP-like protein isoform X2 n=2 Tax=Nelumbo nucifera TaxID=4432 RepID=A0A1U8AJM1_NELNU|nr:PREDICTED: putative G3BP-like protein isoform X2 [Nelumbo nucifera]DAD36878.1 TPA_asm: hypothetical protein HUJ06_007519 [Nelumbo nucifera]